MTVKVNRDELAAILRLAERAAARRENLPVLNGVLLDASTPGSLTVAATDLEMSLRSVLEATSEGGWTRIVDAALLTKLVSRLPDSAVSLTLVGTQLEIRSGAARFTLASLEPDEFPELPALDAAASIRTEASILAGILARVVMAASDSDQRPVMTGVWVEASGNSVTFAATDGARLATQTLMLNAPATLDGAVVRAIIPARAVAEMIRVLEARPAAEIVTLELAERLAGLRAGPHVLTTRLIEGNFPPFRQVILTDPPHTVALPRAALLDAVSRLSLLSRRGPAVVMFEPDLANPGAVQLRAAVPDAGEGVETVALEGGDIWPADVRVAYQARFVEDFLRAVKEPTVRYAVADLARQSQWTAGGLTYLLMPWRTEESIRASQAQAA